MPSRRSPAPTCRGRSVRVARAIPRCCTRRPRKRAPSCTGRRDFRRSNRSSRRRGTGTAGIRMDMATGKPLGAEAGSATAAKAAPLSDRVVLQRLLAYARPYRRRLAWAVVGMLIYAIGSAGLPALIKIIIDKVLPSQQYVAFIAWAIIGLYLLKGLGSYASSYLMAEVGQRVVTDL